VTGEVWSTRIAPLTSSPQTVIEGQIQTKKREVARKRARGMLLGAQRRPFFPRTPSTPTATSTPIMHPSFAQAFQPSHLHEGSVLAIRYCDAMTNSSTSPSFSSLPNNFKFPSQQLLSISWGMDKSGTTKRRLVCAVREFLLLKTLTPHSAVGGPFPRKGNPSPCFLAFVQSRKSHHGRSR
jgi:hypothetical protein